MDPTDPTNVEFQAAARDEIREYARRAVLSAYYRYKAKGMPVSTSHQVIGWLVNPVFDQGRRRIIQIRPEATLP
jgi:hypothetical protein